MNDITLKGYKRNSPYVNSDKLIIDSNNITMKNVDFPIYAKTDLGESKIMYPNKNYHFKSQKVMEIPIHKILNNHFEKYNFTKEEINNFKKEFTDLDENLKSKVLNHISDIGNQSGKMQYMQPYSGDYYFPEDESVTEYPLTQLGGNSIQNIDSKFIYFNDGKKLPISEYESNYVNKLPDLNKNKYDTDERRKTSKLVQDVNSYINQSKIKDTDNGIKSKGFKQDFVEGVGINQLPKESSSSFLEDLVNGFGEPFGLKYNKNFFKSKTPNTQSSAKMKWEMSVGDDNFYTDTKGQRWKKDSAGKMSLIQSNLTPATNPVLSTDQYSGNVADKSKPKLKFNPQKSQVQTVEQKVNQPLNLGKTSFNQKAPDEFTEFDGVTPTVNPIKSKVQYNFSDANIANRTANTFGKKMNDISVLDPRIFKRDEKGNIMDDNQSNEDWQKIVDINPDSPFEYLPMLQGYTNAMYQDQQYRGAANIRGGLTPEIDIRGAIQAIDNELKDGLRNVNLNSTAGQAIAAQLQSNASKSKLNVINEAAVKNAQIMGQNNMSEANRMNQQAQMQNQYDAQYYDNILRSKSASTQEKQKAINALLSRKDQKTAFKTNLALATMPYNNFQIKDNALMRNMKAQFFAPEVNPKKIEEETGKKKQTGGFGSKFKFKTY